MACMFGPADHVPACPESLGVEPEPAQERNRHDRYQRERHRPGFERTNDARAENVGKREQPDDCGRGKDTRGWAADSGDQFSQVADSRDGNGDVADPVAEPVDVVGLETRIRPEEITRVGVWTALLWIQFAEFCEHQAKRRHADGGDHPAEDGDATDLRQIDGQQEEPVPIMLPATSIVACVSDILRPGWLMNALRPP